MIRQFQHGFTPGPLGTGPGIVSSATRSVLHPSTVAHSRTPGFRANPFKPAAKDQGFDQTATPPWLMVPWSDPTKPISRENLRQVRLDFRGMSTAGLRIGTNDSNIADFTVASAGIIEITGRSPGTCFIQIYHTATGDVVAELEVTVKKRIEPSLVFYEVQSEDERTATRRFDRRKPTDLAKLLADANDILRPQTNIQFVAKVPSLVTILIDGNYGRVVNDDDEANDIATKVRDYSSTDPDQEFVSVIFVRNYDTRRTLGENLDGLDSIFLDDRATANTLAHELGHWLLDNDVTRIVNGAPTDHDRHARAYGRKRSGKVKVHAPSSRDLMHETSTTGERIRKAESNAMNESGLFPRATGRKDREDFDSLVEWAEDLLD